MFPVFLSKYWVRVALVTAVLFAFPHGLAAITSEVSEKVSEETEFYHTVQKGDTLWDISSKFFGSPLMWPELWQKNEELPNPHLIYPGQKLRLFLKDGVPRFEVVDKIPSNTKTFTPRPLVSSSLLSNPDKPSNFRYVLIDQVGFLRTPSVAPHGVLFKSRDNKKMISGGDMVYIRPEGEHQLLLGQKYTVFRTLSPLENKKDAEEFGLQHYIVGIVEITDLQPDLAVATVIQSFRSIQVDDLLMPYHPRSPDIEYKDSQTGLEGRLILAEGHYKLIGLNMVCFINKGSRDGVETGQSYVLYYRENKEESGETQKGQLMPAIEFGSFFVLHTEETTATVVITRSDRDIATGINFRASAK
jgi:LysM repeat protein